MAAHRLWIPKWKPRRLNEFLSKHWTARSRMKREDADMVTAYVMQASLPKATVRRRLECTIRLTKRHRLADDDCYQKSLWDALRHAGAIVDDSRKWLEAERIKLVFVENAEEWGTEIILTDLEDATA